MTLFQRDASNILVEIGGYFVRDASNVLVEIGEEWVRDASNTLHLVYSSTSGAMTLDYPPDAYGAGASNSEIGVTTTAVTVTVTGGRAPYTYLWALVGGPDPSWIITAPNAKTTAFRRFEMAPGDNFNTTVTCTVTDASGQSVETNPIAVTVENFGGLGGLLP